GIRFHGRSGQIFGGFLFTLGAADARKGRAVRHELIVQPQLLVSSFQNGDLVVIVIDGELRGNPRRISAKAAPSRRSKRTQNEWKVATVGWLESSAGSPERAS